MDKPNIKNIIQAKSILNKYVKVNSNNTIKALTDQVAPSFIINLKKEKIELQSKIKKILLFDQPSSNNQIKNSIYFQNKKIITNKTDGVSEIEQIITDKLKANDDKWNKEIEAINIRIKEIDDELAKFKDKVKLKTKIKANKDKIKLKQQQFKAFRTNFKNQAKNIFKANKDIINILSIILNTFSSQIVILTSNIRKEVDNFETDIVPNITNDVELQIAIKTKENIEAKILTDEKLIMSVKKIVQILTIINSIITPLLRLISLLPPVAVTGAVITTFNRLKKILDDASSLLYVVNSMLNYLINDLEIQKARLKIYNDLLNNSIINSSSNFIDSLLNNNNKLGYISSYKNYDFYIKEEDNPKFVVKGNKRRYAVAIKNNVEYYKSEYSFTLNPTVLIDELKLKIDKENN